MSRPPQAGDQVTIFGYGLDQFGNAGTLRQGTSIITAVFSDFWVSIFDTNSQSNSCNGDSGGPAVFSYIGPDGQHRSGIVGMVAAGTSDTCMLGDNSLYVNTQSPDVLGFITARVRRVKLQ